MEADAAGAQAGDSAAAACAAEYAGIGAQPKAERSELHARDERRRSSDAERFEPPACRRSTGPAERIESRFFERQSGSFPPFNFSSTALTTHLVSRHRD